MSLESLAILVILNDEGIDAKFKAMNHDDLREKTELSIAKFREQIYRLEALNFVEVVRDNSKKSLFITGYGITAVQQALEKELE